MNNCSNYEQQLSEFKDEDPEGLQKFLDEQYEKALASYPEDCDEELYRCCPICGALLVYQSLSYYEGYHFDSCL